jgi:hypothetical protein
MVAAIPDSRFFRDATGLLRATRVSRLDTRTQSARGDKCHAGWDGRLNGKQYEGGL